MKDGPPKDYSKLYTEDGSRRPALPPIPRSSAPEMDGCRQPVRRNEAAIDLQAVVDRLNCLSKESCKTAARNTLTSHYNNIMSARRLVQDKPEFRAHIQYCDDQDQPKYIVQTRCNTLSAVKDRLPKIGNYRYFFRQMDNTWEEYESENSTIPCFIANGQKQIYCRLFKI